MTYHITDLDTFNANVDCFREAHWMPAGDKIVCACMCTEDHTLAMWKANPNVISLPDPLRNQAVGAENAAALAVFGVLATDTTFDVADKLDAVNQSFKFDFR